MRTKDDQKRKALIRSTITLVNEIGFAASSVSKIAREAGVSSSTLYVFFKNKEDLLVSAYLELKREMGQYLLEDFDDTLPFRDIVKGLWRSTYRYMVENREHHEFLEQFANSPYGDLVNMEVVEKYFAPFVQTLQKGIAQKIIKNVDRNFLIAFLFPPIARLANPRVCDGFELTEADIETAFTMTWDAIKL